jgi:hypothetical protein
MSILVEAQAYLEGIEASIGDLVPVSSAERSRAQMAKS